MFIDKKNEDGFTMIELLIVVAITMIMTGVLFAMQNGDKAYVSVDSASRLVASQIRTLQGESINGKVINGKFANVLQFSEILNAQTYSIQYLSSSFVDVGGGLSPSIANNKVKFGSDVNFYFKTPSSVLTPVVPAVFTPGGNIEIKIVSMVNPATVGYVCVSNRGSVVEQKISCP